MSVIAIAQLSLTDVEAYRRYQARFMDVFMRYSGRLLAAYFVTFTLDFQLTYSYRGNQD